MGEVIRPPYGEAERWFLAHGLSYFVPQVRADAVAALRPRRFVPPLLAVVLVAVAVGVGLAWVLEERTAAPAIVASAAAVGALWYALTAVRARQIVTWGLARTFGHLRTFVPIVSRALPLLLLFVTFLFVNAEAWQMAASLSFPLLWLTVLLLAAFAVVFLLVRLPDEVDRVDDAVDAALVRRATVGTPLEAATAEALDAGADPAPYAAVTGFARLNLILVLLVVQVGQALLLAAAVFAFFLLFGALVMNAEVQSSWTGVPTTSFAFLPNLSYQLLKVSLFLAAFSGLYFTISAVTDETYRAQFFAAVTDELERAVGVRAAYLMLRDCDGGPEAG